MELFYFELFNGKLVLWKNVLIDLIVIWWGNVLMVNFVILGGFFVDVECVLV